MTGQVASSATGARAFPTLTLWLVRGVDGTGPADWCLERVAAMTGHLHHNIKFDTMPDARETICEDLYGVLGDYLPSGTGKHLLAADNLLLELRSAVLYGLRVTGLSVRSGLQRVTVTFKHFLGGIGELFRAGRAPDLLDDVVCRLSTRAIQDVVLPALNIAVATPELDEAYQSQEERRIETAWKSLCEKKVELEFYLSLLMRFVRSCDRSAQVTGVTGVRDTLIEASQHLQTRQLTASGA